MRQRALTLTMAVVLIVSAFAGVMGAPAVAESHADDQASVTFTGGTTGGSTVVVDEVHLPEGGFVTIHDDSLTDGNVLGSVVGTSEYLEAGTHENVTVELTDEIDDGTYHAMAHRDTTDDRTYRFVSSNGEADGPYTVDGDIVMESASVTVSATISAVDQSTEGEYVIVDRVELSEGGFVTVHDSSLADGAVFESIRGTSTYLEAGIHENVRIQLDEPLSNDDTLLPMAHRDTNDNQAYDFPETEGEEDGPYVDADNEIVMTDIAAEIDDEAAVEFSNATSGGHTVVVDEVYLPEGGFVTMHDSSLADGAVFESIRGTSGYLEPGIHRDVVVTLDEPLADDDTLFAMAHQDTNDNQTYDFPDTEGEEDGPYTDESGDIVMADGAVTVAASVAFDTQTSDGTTVVIDRVDLSEGGFVTVHDARLLDGAAFESVIGTSAYLEAGVHENVEIQLDNRMKETQQLVTMPHLDTDDDQTYDFVETEGDDDGPYVDDDGIIMTAATAQVTASVVGDADMSDAESIVVEEVTLHDGGFVTVHDSTLLDGEVFESVRGTSAYLEAGTHTNVEITLDEPLETDDTVFAMAHRDTNDNQEYDFLTSDGSADGPYVAAGSPAMAAIDVSVAEEMSDNDEMEDESDENNAMEDEEMDSDDETENEGEMNSEDTSTDGMTDDGVPGFGVIVAIVALLAAALLVTRRN